MNASLLPSNRPLRATVIFGIIDAKASTFDYPKFLKTLSVPSSSRHNGAVDTFEKLISVAKLPASPLPTDRGSIYFHRFITKLSTVFNRLLAPPTVDSEAQTVILRAKLARSLREMELRVFFGPTDMLAGDPPSHWASLREAMRSSDIVLYNGHSGLGENFKISNMFPTDSGSDRVPAALPAAVPVYQLIGVLSCYSYAYFGDEFARFRQDRNPASVTDLIVTGSDFTSERGPLGVFNYLDQQFSKEKKPSTRTLIEIPQFVPADQILIKSYSSGNPDR